MSYLLVGRGLGVPLAKAPIYLLAAAMALESIQSAILDAVTALLVLEGTVGVARRQWNDVVDYEGDLLRGDRWSPAFAPEHRRLVLLIAGVRSVAGIALMFASSHHFLGLAGVGLLVLQWLYHHRPADAPPVAVGIVVVGYAVRFIGAAADITPMPSLVWLVLGLLLFAATDQVLQWRRAESAWISRRGLQPKQEYIASSLSRNIQWSVAFLWRVGIVVAVALLPHIATPILLLTLVVYVALHLAVMPRDMSWRMLATPLTSLFLVIAFSAAVPSKVARIIGSASIVLLLPVQSSPSVADEYFETSDS